MVTWTIFKKGSFQKKVQIIWRKWIMGLTYKKDPDPHTYTDKTQMCLSYKNIYQLRLILTALLHVDLLKVAYLNACAFIKSWLRCTFWMTSSMTLNPHNNL